MNIHRQPVTMTPLLFLLFLLSEAASDPVMVRAGSDVILSCEAADPSIAAVEWTKSDLGSAEYVLFYRDGRSDTTNQLSSFKGRVQLIESELKKGNVSLILMNVSSSDGGTYECRVAYEGSRQRRSANIDNDPIKTINLQVLNPDSTSGNMDETPPISSRGHAAVAVGCVLLCSAVVFMFLFQKYKRQTDNRSAAAADDPGDEQLV